MGMIELPAGYYLTNFQTLLSFVSEHYRDILSEEERAFAQNFDGLDQDAARLYVRLISRKGPHFRRDKIDYPEIGDLDKAIETLVAQGFCVRDAEVETQVLLSMLVRAELEELMHGVGVPSWPRNMRKDELLAYCQTHVADEKWTGAFFDRYTLITPLHAEILLVYRLLFFGNLAQDLTEFVLEDLGVLRFETYAINKEDRLFHQRAMITQTLAYLHARECAWVAAQEGDLETLLALCNDLPDTLGESVLQRRHDRILNDTARHLERLGEWDAALSYYGRASLPPARERTARIYEKQGHLEKAHALCQDILDLPRDEDEREFAKSFGFKMARKLGLTKEKARRVQHPTEKATLERNLDLNIEAQVLVHFASLGIEGFRAENRLWNDLFGLLFWDIIFAPVRGAFFNRFQRGPKGLFSPRFRDQRNAAVTQRLAEIGRGVNLLERARETFETKHGVANYLVNWRTCEWAIVERVLTVVPATHLAAIFDRLTRNPGEYRSGLPDLFVFTGDLGYTLVEVKGPGDQIQGNQGRWMRYFKEHGIPYQVARIAWAEV